jgi:transposase
MYLTGMAHPDFHTIAQFRKRFRPVLQDLFRQVLALCRKAGLVRLDRRRQRNGQGRQESGKHQRAQRVVHHSSPSCAR